MPKWAKILIIVLLAISAIVAIIFGITVAAGIKLYNDAEEVSDEMIENMDALAVQLFNAEFETHVGESIKGSIVKALISKVEINNETSEDKVKLEGITTKEEVDSSATYTVKESYGKNGMINKITITKN